MEWEVHGSVVRWERRGKGKRVVVENALVNRMCIVQCLYADSIEHAARSLRVSNRLHPFTVVKTSQLLYMKAPSVFAARSCGIEGYHLLMKGQKIEYTCYCREG